MSKGIDRAKWNGTSLRGRRLAEAVGGQVDRSARDVGVYVSHAKAHLLSEGYGAVSGPRDLFGPLHSLICLGPVIIDMALVLSLSRRTYD